MKISKRTPTGKQGKSRESYINIINCSIGIETHRREACTFEWESLIITLNRNEIIQLHSTIIKEIDSA